MHRSPRIDVRRGDIEGQVRALISGDQLPAALIPQLAMLYLGLMVYGVEPVEVEALQAHFGAQTTIELTRLLNFLIGSDSIDRPPFQIRIMDGVARVTWTDTPTRAPDPVIPFTEKTDHIDAGAAASALDPYHLPAVVIVLVAEMYAAFFCRQESEFVCMGFSTLNHDERIAAENALGFLHGYQFDDPPYVIVPRDGDRIRLAWKPGRKPRAVIPRRTP